MTVFEAVMIIISVLILGIGYTIAYIDLYKNTKMIIQRNVEVCPSIDNESEE